jgi:hypothetical protein
MAASVENMHCVSVLQIGSFDEFDLARLATDASSVLVERRRTNQSQCARINMEILSLAALIPIGAPAHSVYAACTGRWHKIFPRHLVAAKAELITWYDICKCPSSLADVQVQIRAIGVIPFAVAVYHHAIL